VPRPLVTALLATASLTLAGCAGDSSAADDGTLTIVTSTSVYADLARQVAGDEAEVTALIDSPSADPHSFESDARDILTVSKADLVIENGGGYDAFVDQLLDSAKNDPVVLYAVDVSGLDAGEHEDSEHEDEHDHGSFNEHVWYDVVAMRQLVEAIADELGTLDPDGADTYAANADRLVADLDALIDHQAKLSEQLGGAPVAVTEPVPGYLIDSLGLRDLTPPAFSEAIEEGDDVSVSVLAETLDLFSSGAVEALVYNEQTTGPTTEQVESAAEDAGIPVVGVTETLPEGDDYVSWMTAATDAVAGAIEGR